MVFPAGKASPPVRRLITVLVILGLVVILDLALFGWLIFRSLSQREIERVLLEARQEAAGLAEQIAERAADGDSDLFTVMAVEREFRQYIDDTLREVSVVGTVSLYNAEGELVYEQTSERREGVGGGALLEDAPDLALGAPQEVPSVPRTEQSERRLEYQVDEPIGDFGVLTIGISPEDLQARIGELRRHLVGRAAVIGLLTLLILAGAFLVIWKLMQRSQRFEEQAAEAERMAYIGTLASGLAHEIRNPLNSVNLNMQMLEEELGDYGGGPNGGRLLAITRSEIARLERLVTDFLSYARPRPLDLEVIEAGALLGQVRELLAGEARNLGVDLRVEDRSRGGRLRADTGQIRQLLLNLTQNALAAVIDPVATDRGRAPRVVLAAERRPDELVLQVEDEGPGIPPEELSRIFEIFYSTRKGGTGLGLAIVERIARNHGGRVALGSTSEGTIARVHLPVALDPLSPGAVTGEDAAPAEEAPRPDAARPRPAVAGRGRRG